MPRIRRPRAAALTLTLALSALLAPIAASAATSTAPTDRSAPPPTFSVPASARVHGSTPTTTPASAAPKVATPPTGAAGSATPTTPVATAPVTAVPATTTPASATPPSTTTAPATGVPASTTPALPTATGAPGTRHAATSTRLSTEAIVAATLAVLLILVCLAWGAARWFAYEPRWSISLRHSLAEASWRLSASWDEFSDWARLGR